MERKLIVNRAAVSSPLDLLSYYCKDFSITTVKESFDKYKLIVYSERKQVVVEMVIVEEKDFGVLTMVEQSFEELKTKYILDYQKKLEG